jgi:hypothetical protein
VSLKLLQIPNLQRLFDALDIFTRDHFRSIAITLLQSEWSLLLRRNSNAPAMPRLKNRLHERFAKLVAERMDRKAA